MNTDFWEIFFSLAIPALVILIVALIIGSADSLDQIVFGR